jgi:hypothetical protein
MVGNDLDPTPPTIATVPEPALDRSGHPDPPPRFEVGRRVFVRIPENDRYDVDAAARRFAAGRHEVPNEAGSVVEDSHLRGCGQLAGENDEIEVHVPLLSVTGRCGSCERIARM